MYKKNVIGFLNYLFNYALHFRRLRQFYLFILFLFNQT